METYNNNSIESGKSNGRQMMILLLLGVLGVAGLIYVLNASSSKSAFSDLNETPIEMQSEYAESGIATAAF
jgi:hypothetical protein